MVLGGILCNKHHAKTRGKVMNWLMTLIIFLASLTWWNLYNKLCYQLTKSKPMRKHTSCWNVQDIKV